MSDNEAREYMDEKVQNGLLMAKLEASKGSVSKLQRENEAL